ncbi:MAG: NADH dehydrogenase [Ignavibacteria bacterium RBG_13_36_8]|nr:MAG: NADH dehydrogenase [Ignavibacteria bacterium RBG_13_36_8]
MKKSEEIFEILKQQFSDAVIELKTDLPVEPIIIIDPMKIDKIGLFLRDTNELEFDTLLVLSGVDEADGEKVKEGDGSETITGGKLSVYYHLHSTKLNHKVTLKVVTPRENPEVASVESIWKAANWHEREVYDMFGVKFHNHPDLRRILLPYDWEGGYPLRKDFKVPEFYRGMKIPY